MSPSLAKSLPAIVTTLAPLETTSWIFPRVKSAVAGSLIKAITGVSFSIRAIVPCFNSAAANNSVWIYETYLSLNSPSKATA